jgi:hypothetical protein
MPAFAVLSPCYTCDFGLFLVHWHDFDTGAIDEQVQLLSSGISLARLDHHGGFKEGCAGHQPWGSVLYRFGELRSIRLSQQDGDDG